MPVLTPTKSSKNKLCNQTMSMPNNKFSSGVRAAGGRKDFARALGVRATPRVKTCGPEPMDFARGLRVAGRAEESKPASKNRWISLVGCGWPAAPKKAQNVAHIDVFLSWVGMAGHAHESKPAARNRWISLMGCGWSGRVGPAGPGRADYNS